MRPADGRYRPAPGACPRARATATRCSSTRARCACWTATRTRRWPGAGRSVDLARRFDDRERELASMSIPRLRPDVHRLRRRLRRVARRRRLATRRSRRRSRRTSGRESGHGHRRQLALAIAEAPGEADGASAPGQRRVGFAVEHAQRALHAVGGRELGPGGSAWSRSITRRLASSAALFSRHQHEKLGHEAQVQACRRTVAGKLVRGIQLAASAERVVRPADRAAGNGIGLEPGQAFRIVGVDGSAAQRALPVLGRFSWCEPRVTASLAAAGPKRARASSSLARAAWCASRAAGIAFSLATSTAEHLRMQGLEQAAATSEDSIATRASSCRY